MAGVDDLANYDPSEFFGCFKVEADGLIETEEGACLVGGAIEPRALDG